MASIISPNMSLIIPTAGSEPGPTYALDINSSLTLIDLHDHTPGKGIAITPAAMNIDSNLSLNSFSLIDITSLVFTASVSAVTTPMALSVAPGGESPQQQDLWFTPDTGIPIQITKNGAVNATVSSIDGETYASGTFFWTQSQDSLPTTPANFDIGSIVLRPNTAGTSFGVQLVPPSAIASQYSINLPLLPASQKIMTLDASGNMTAPYTVDGSTIVVAANVIKVPDGGITDTQIALATITGNRMVAHTVTSRELADGLNGTWNEEILEFAQPAFNVRVATTTNGTFTTAFDNASTVDGVTLATNDLILIKDQTDGSQNGVYVVQASGSPVRDTSYDTFAELNVADVHVTAGTTNAGTNWAQSTKLTYISDSQVWIRGSHFSFLVPDDVTLIILEGCGAGGGGGGGSIGGGSTGGAGGSGGASATPNLIELDVVPGETIYGIIGQGGAGGSGSAGGTDGQAGGDTIIKGTNFYIYLPGAVGGLHGTSVAGGAAISGYSTTVDGDPASGTSGAGSSSPATQGNSANRTILAGVPALGGGPSSGGTNRGRPGGGGAGSFGPGGAGGDGMTVGAGTGNVGTAASNYGAGGGGGSGGLATTAGGVGGIGGNGVAKLHWLGNAS